MKTENLTIVIPAYNEEESLKTNLVLILEHCKQKGYKLIIVNDGSLDNTKSYCNFYASNYECLTVLSHKVNRGYGGAIKTGIESVNTELVITIDADGQHRLEDVDFLLEQMSNSEADMIVGNRGSKQDNFYRGIGKKIIRIFSKILLPIPIKDLNSGMKIYRTELIKKYLHLCPNSMAFSDVVLLVFVNFRHLVYEKPITIQERTNGTSTISTMTAFETVKEITNIVLLFNPLRVFIPLSLMIFIGSVLWGLPFIIEGAGISVGTMVGVVSSILLLILGFLAEQISQIRLNSVKDKPYGVYKVLDKTFPQEHI